jgi:hypothetical protein
MTIEEFSKQLIEKSLLNLAEKSGTCNSTGAGTSCPRHGDADCNSSKQNRAEGLMPEELVGTTYEIVMEDGETIIIEKVKMDGKDDNGFKSCWKGYRKTGTKMKGGKEVNNCVKSEEWEGSKEDKGEDKKLAKKNKMSLKDWEKSDADKKHDMKKEETEKKESEKDEGGKHKEYKHAPGKEEKGEKKTEKEMKKEAKDYLPGNQEKLDANKNGKLDADDFKKLRAKKGKTVKEMWQVAEGKKVEIEIMPQVDTPNDPEPPKSQEDLKKKTKKKQANEQVELEEKKLSAKETAKKEKFVKGMKKKYGSFKSKYGEKAQSVMYGSATNMAKKAA